MITVINDKELGKVTIVTQQYQVGSLCSYL